MSDPRIILALDGMSFGQRLLLLEKIDPRSIWGVKFNDGIIASGAESVRLAKQMGFRVFADPKLHDIPATVRNGARILVEAGADLITVHASGGAAMIQAAVEATAGTETRILAVTVLTSMSEIECREIYGGPPSEVVPRFARTAARAGAHGIVCSPQELALLTGDDLSRLIRVTPGVRSPGAETHDQSRVGTPAGAILSGADLIVVGREVTQAEDPVAAIARINSDIAAAIPD